MPGPALQAAQQLERTWEMSLLGEYFVSLSEPVVSWEGVIGGGGAGICYCCLPSYPVAAAGSSCNPPTLATSAALAQLSVPSGMS